MDDVPAATLLLPYFEVDTTRGDGTTTLFSVINTVAEPTLAHVVLWTDLGVPSVDFDIYLTGFDVYTLNLRDVFVGGRVPETGPQVSPEGPLGFPNIPFPHCEGAFETTIPEAFRQALVDLHQGRSSLLYEGLCGAAPHEDGIARGYVTIDVVRECGFIFPSQEGYFGPEGVASYENRLLGDAFFVDPANNFAQGENLVRLEADAEAFGPGDRTFYAGFVGGDGSDGREPLPTVWASRMIDGGGFGGGTELTVWRGLTEPQEAFECNGPLPQLPVSSEVFAFDEEENAQFVFPNTGIIDPPPNLNDIAPFPLATNRVRREDFAFFQPQPFGWVSMDLSELPYLREVISPFAQAWIGSTFSASGLFSVGLDASPLSGACSTEGCTHGEPAEAGELCVLGRDFPGIPTGVLEVLPGAPIDFTIRPRGCFSSSCTQVYQLSCAFRPLEGDTLTLLPKMCLAQNDQEGVVCTDDCLGDLQERCIFQDGLAEGTYTVRAGDLELTLPVPSTIPQDGLCVGEPF